MKSEIAKRLALEAGLRRGIQWLYPPTSVWTHLEIAVVREAWHQVFDDADCAAKAVDLHVNIPFSTWEPRYCDYIHARAPRAVERGRYIQLLRKEFDSLNISGGARFRRLFFTGAAATILTPAQIDQLFKRVLSKILLANKDAAMEIGHCPATLETLVALSQHGVRRTVIDVHSMEAELSARIGWSRSRRDVGRLLDRVRSAGIRSVRFNVTAGFPGQTMDGFAGDLKFLLSLQPDSILLQPFSPAPLPALDAGSTSMKFGSWH